MSSKRASLAGLLLATVAGCLAPDVDAARSTTDEITGVARQKMVGGTVSTVAQDATVLLLRADFSCSGSLIAPNLVLTARHCVAPPNESQEECVGYGANYQASTIEVYVGVNASPDNGGAAARGSTITVPQTANMCSFDVALIQLDRDIPNARIAPVRFSEIAPNEQVTAVGYGVDGADKQLPQRMQRATTVLGVGPKAIQYKTKQNISIDYNIPQGDVTTGESTCYGDSGGPLFDAQGRVVAMTSRGLINFPQNGAHGNGCIDLPSIYSSARFNEQLIRQAAQAAGHPLPAGDSSPSTGNGKNQDDSGDVDPQSDDDDSTSDDEATDEQPTKKRKKTTSVPVQSAACSMTPGGAMSASWLPIVGIALALASRRRSR